MFAEEQHPDKLKLQKKRVHFAGHGKENQTASDDTTTTVTRVSETGKTADLKERLDQAKLRGVALKQAEITSKYRSKQLLSMR